MRTALALALALAAVPALAQTTQQGTKGQPQSQQGASSATKQFVEKAAIGDMYEIQSSQMALDKTQDQQFRSFAQRIVNDHQQSSSELKSLAEGMQGVQVPTELDSKHKDMLGELTNASGAQFNQLYREQQLTAHREAVQLYRDYSQNGENTELKQFASKTLPKLQDHLQLAQNLPQGQMVGQAPKQSQTGQSQTGQSQQDQQARATPPAASGQRSAGTQQSGIIAAPGSNHMLSSALRGTTVYGANQENIGDINDVVLSRDGQVVAVVVGVGGFLGLGEKDVAIPFDAIEIRESGDQGGTTQTQRQTDNTRSGQQAQGTAPIRPNMIVLKGMTKAQLEAAPSFRTDQNR
jgi:putative membrane protein